MNEPIENFVAELHELKAEFEKLLECLEVDRVVVRERTGNAAEPFYSLTKFKRSPR
jgi:hypothetical protein